MNKLRIFLTAFLFAAGIAACGTRSQAIPTSSVLVPSLSNPPAATKTATTVPAKPSAIVSTSVSFSKDILPILKNYCVNCHGGQRTENGLNLNTYEGVMVGGKDGAVVHAGNAGNSQLLQLILQGKMPKRGAKPTPDQIKMIEDWIDQGALDN